MKYKGETIEAWAIMVTLLSDDTLMVVRGANGTFGLAHSKEVSSAMAECINGHSTCSKYQSVPVTITIMPRKPKPKGGKG